MLSWTPDDNRCTQSCKKLLLRNRKLGYIPHFISEGKKYMLFLMVAIAICEGTTLKKIYPQKKFLKTQDR
jgi:hypothetical protein